MFNTEPPAGARAVPGGECRPREEATGGAGPPLCDGWRGGLGLGLNQDAEPSCACLLCHLVSQLPRACFFLCEAGVVSNIQPSCFM